MKIEAVLFDLDNTLILFEEVEFFKIYTEKLYLSFMDLMTPDDFTRRLIYSTQAMVNNNGEMNNAEYFIRDFAKGAKADEQELGQHFANFYENEFEQFRPIMTPLDGVREVISTLQNMGLKLVIASNPMFPINVQITRLRWAYLDDIPFELITASENSTYIKPRLEYYNQICEKIDIPPQNCMMVGNDAFNDMIASKIGMRTYLTTDSDHLSIELSRELAKGANLEMPTPDYKGPLKDLVKVIIQLNISHQ